MAVSPLSGRDDLPSGLVTAKTGGVIWWAVVVSANSTDSWPSAVTAYGYGSISTTSWAAGNFQTGKLIDIDDIDLSADIFDNPLSKMGETSFTIENLSGHYNTLRNSAVNFIGRKATVYMGSGATITAATGAAMFTGSVKSIEPDGLNLRITLRALAEKQNKIVGTVLPETVDKKYRGKIIPISYGAWTDDDAFLPCIMDAEFNMFPRFKLDDRAWKSFSNLYIYDSQNSAAYKIKGTSDYKITDYNQISFWDDTGTTLKNAVTVAPAGTRHNIQVNNSMRITYYAGGVNGVETTDVAPQTIICIDSEYMLVHGVNALGLMYSGSAPTTTEEVYVERGWMGTTPAAHSASAVVYQISSDASKVLLECQAVFWANLLSGVFFSTGAEFTARGTVFETTPMKNFQDQTDYYGLRLSHNCTYAAGIMKRMGMDLVFPKTNLSGTILNQFLLIKCETDATLIDGVSVMGSIALTKDGLTVDFNNTRQDFCRIMRPTNSTRSTAGTTTEAYDNTTGGSNETDLNLVAWRCKLNTTFTVTVGSIYSSSPAGTDGVYFKIVNTFDLSGSTYVVIARVSGRGDVSTITYGHKVLSNGNTVLTASLVLYAISVSGGDAATLYIESIDTTGIFVTDISNIASTRYSIIYAFQWSGVSNGQVDHKLYKIGFRCDFLVDPRKYDFFGRAEGRVIPAGGYFGYSAGGAVGDLIEAPAIVVEDIVRNEVPGLASTDMNEDYFKYFHDTDDRHTWKIAHSIYDEPKYFRDILKDILPQFGALMFERYDGKMALVSTEMPAAATRNIADSEIKTKSQGGANVADWSFGFSDQSNIITGINVKYKPIIPDNGKFAAVKCCRRSGWDGSDGITAATDGYFDSDTSAYEAYLQHGYGQLGEENIVTIEAPAIRDEATAELYAKSIILWRFRPLIVLNLNCTYSVIDLEMFNKVGLSLTFIPTHLQSKTWIIIGYRLTTSIGGKDGGIQLTLLEMGQNTDPDFTIYQDTYATGTDWQDTYATGDDYQDTF